jgi:hypothetical protein
MENPVKFKYFKRSDYNFPNILDPNGNIITFKDQMTNEKFNFIFTKKSYLKKLPRITDVISYFTAFYNTDHFIINDLCTYNKLMMGIENPIELEFIIHEHILTYSVRSQILEMGRQNSLLEFGEHADVITSASFAINLISPILFHYLWCTNTPSYAQTQVINYIYTEVLKLFGDDSYNWFINYIESVTDKMTATFDKKDVVTYKVKSKMVNLVMNDILIRLVYVDNPKIFLEYAIEMHIKYIMG